MPAADPQPIALIVCENVYADSDGKRALIGLFNKISASNADGPIIQPKMCVYLSMTEVDRGTVIKLEIANGETDEVVVRAESPPAPLDINPTTIFDFQFELKNISFPEPGIYLVKFCGNNNTLLQRPIEVIRDVNEELENEHNQS